MHIILGSWAFLVPVLVSLRTEDNGGINLRHVVTRPLSDTWVFHLALLLASCMTSLSQRFFVYKMIMDDVMIKMR